MKFRALFKDSSFLVQLLMLIVAVFIGYVAGIVLYSLYVLLSGGNLTAMVMDSQTIRMMLLFTSSGAFLLPSIFLAYIFSDNVSVYMQLNKPKITALVLTILALCAFMPFLNLTVHLNEQMVLPAYLKGLEDWLKQIESEAQAVTTQVLQTDSVGIFLFNILIFGVIAGVGEEFLFRGVMQRMFAKILRNPHTIIWVVAIIFSAVHMQFYGFLPRMLLGALMGYLLLWTKSLWIPVIAHFLNNSISVIARFFFPEADEFDKMNTVGTGDTLWMAALSLVLGIAFCYLIKKVSDKNRHILSFKNK